MLVNQGENKNGLWLVELAVEDKLLEIGDTILTNQPCRRQKPV